VSSPTAVLGEAAEASLDMQHRVTLPPRETGPKLPPATINREAPRSAPLGARAPASGARVRPQDTPPREPARVSEPARDTDANDPGAVIDWLMRKSGR
jgi:hypothetical protein